MKKKDKRIKRLELTIEIGDIIQKKCKNCEEVPKVNGLSDNKFCSEFCKIGEQLKDLGNELLLLSEK